MEPATARVIWQGLEHLHAVTYFAPECRSAPRDLGLQGFWTGYFASRAAPMGAVGAGVVEAAFFNFHPNMVRDAIPQAWAVAPPSRLVEARATAAAAALERTVPDSADVAADLVERLTRAVEAADGAGRALFCANREVALPEHPVAALWQCATTLREHRGDGHVAALTAEGLDGCEVHVLLSVTEGIPAELLQRSRGWSTFDWQEASGRLVDRGLLNLRGTPTDRGSAVRAGIEARTDELGARPYRVLTDEDVDRLIDVISRAARAVAATELIPYPNPMGLPRPHPEQ